MNNKNTGIESVGNSLIEYVRDAAATRPGIVEELFPYIVQASKKISARGIARFLEERHGVKVSYVTIGRALRNPEKYWNRYYDEIESHARCVGESHGKPLKDFMSEPEKYQAMLETKPVYQADSAESALDAMGQYEHAITVLDEKWFCFDEAILEEARMHLYQRMCKKPTRQNDDAEGQEV
jgi:hypothetical protein